MNAKVDGVGQMAGWSPHTSIQESKIILDMFMKEKNVFALELKNNHKVIGSLGLEEISLSLNRDYDDFCIGREIGYVLSKVYWGGCLMPEAVNRVIRFCFENEKYDYLMCSHSVVNHQSKRVIEKSGFRFVKENIRMAQNGMGISQMRLKWLKRFPNGNREFPKQKDIKKSPVFTCLQKY